MANNVNQASANPTNKLTAATVASAFMGVLALALKNLFPEWYDPETMLALSPIVAYVAGWLIRDKPNITVVMEDSK
jgi:hypothetical protein